jgi:pimeloyl-ACP methyl ester carboxylesterase
MCNPAEAWAKIGVGTKVRFCPSLRTGLTYFWHPALQLVVTFREDWPSHSPELSNVQTAGLFGPCHFLEVSKLQAPKDLRARSKAKELFSSRLPCFTLQGLLHRRAFSAAILLDVLYGKAGHTSNRKDYIHAKHREMKTTEQQLSKQGPIGQRSVRTAVATISYFEDGPLDGAPVFLLHGFPDDPTGFDKVVDRVSKPSFRLIRPFLRGFGQTEVNEPGAKSGEAAALGQDLLDLADALGISVFKVVGHDWGSRAGHAAAILAPHRISRLLAIWSPFFANPNLPFHLRLQQTQAFWYQLYFHTREGKLALEQQAAELAEHIWRTWSPTWKFATEELLAILPSFNNASFAETVVSYYQHRWNVGLNSTVYKAQRAALRTVRTVDVPTTFICGDADACTLPAVSRNLDRFYTAGYESIELAGVGHFPHRELPTAVADLILDFMNA